MPATRKQMKIAGRELRLRREGKVVKEKDRASAKRPMGAMTDENLRKYAQSIDKEIAKLEKQYKQSGSQEHAVWLQRAKNQKIREYGSE